MGRKGYLLYNGKMVTGEGENMGVILTIGKRISRIWKNCNPAEIREIVGKYRDMADIRLSDLGGKLVFAGGIDAHVHFREPGMTAKADMSSESKAALLGGVTSFIDMPNTRPATVSAAALKEKTRLAEGRSYANYGFHFGAANDNIREIKEIISKGKDGITRHDFGGIKVFMGSSTGNMLVDDAKVLEELFRIKGKEILVHCEDEATIRKNIDEAKARFGEDIPVPMHSYIRSREACILSSGKALQTAVRFGTRLHLLHISTREEMEMVKSARTENGNITAETSANYLWFDESGYSRLGNRMKCNPSIKTADDRAYLRAALKAGDIDTIGSDHAPHLPEDKEGGYLSAPSGLPSIQQTLQVLLTVAYQENIPLRTIAAVFSERVSEIFGITDRGKLKEGCSADIVVVDPDIISPVCKEDLAYKCGWSPYEGETLRGKITDVFINGHRAIEDSILHETPFGEKLVFER